jgi:hypothetical protein
MFYQPKTKFSLNNKKEEEIMKKTLFISLLVAVSISLLTIAECRATCDGGSNRGTIIGFVTMKTETG